MSTNEKTIKEKFKGFKGKVTFTNFLIDSDEAEKISEVMGRRENMRTHEFDFLFNRLKDICEVKEMCFDNMIVSVGRQVFAGLLIGETTYSGEINYGALGTGSTAVNDADTVLDTEVKRKSIATRSRVGNTITLRFFYTKSDTNGTYEEFGTFIDGTSSADTGAMFNRVLTGGWVKTALEALTVTVQFDLNNS